MYHLPSPTALGVVPNRPLEQENDRRLAEDALTFNLAGAENQVCTSLTLLVGGRRTLKRCAWVLYVPPMRDVGHPYYSGTRGKVNSDYPLADFSTYHGQLVTMSNNKLMKVEHTYLIFWSKV